MEKEWIHLDLWREKNGAALYRRENKDQDIRPAMLVVPGGGYHNFCVGWEGYPIAEKFESLGFRCFIVEYRIGEHCYPRVQQDLLRAVKLVRANAAAWGVRKDNVAVCGFSAGGHLCACAATLYDKIEANNGDAADGESPRPDAAVLCYPVITSGKYTHRGSYNYLFGAENEARFAELSLEKRVTPQSVPCFVWHTALDKTVPYQNSVLMAQALVDAGVPCEFHLFPQGDHGMGLGQDREDISRWPDMVKSFLKLTLGFHFQER